MDGLKEEQSYYSKAFCAVPAKLQSNTLIITLYDLEKVNTVYIKVALATNLVSLWHCLEDLVWLFFEVVKLWKVESAWLRSPETWRLTEVEAFPTKEKKQTQISFKKYSQFAAFFHLKHIVCYFIFLFSVFSFPS